MFVNFHNIREFKENRIFLQAILLTLVDITKMSLYRTSAKIHLILNVTSPQTNFHCLSNNKLQRQFDVKIQTYFGIL